MSGNICNYEPIINLSIRDLNRRLRFIHQYLCFLSSSGGGGAAADGLSISTAGETVLGQDVGEAGSPAVLTSVREVPTGGFSVNFIDSGLSTDVSAGVIGLHNEDNTLVINMNTNASTFINLRDNLSNAPYIQLNTSNASEQVNLINLQGFFHITKDLTFDFIVDVNNAEVVINGGRLGIETTPTARIHIGGSSGSPGTAPIKIDAGTFMSPSEVGGLEYDGTNLTFVRIADREDILMASSVATETVTADSTITVNIGGTNYKLVAQAV